jgi:ribosome-binding protein aMBF1 (putative translation factor)
MNRPQPDRWFEVEPISLGPDDSPEVISRSSDKWSELRAGTLSDPAARERYERKFKSALAVRRMLQMIDSERERTGLSKSDLARMIGVSPATVRRLFTSPTSNPTLKTVVDLLSALDLGIEVRPRDGTRTNGDSGNTDRLNASAPSVTR